MELSMELVGEGIFFFECQSVYWSRVEFEVLVDMNILVMGWHFAEGNHIRNQFF